MIDRRPWALVGQDCVLFGRQAVFGEQLSIAIAPLVAADAACAAPVLESGIPPTATSAVLLNLDFNGSRSDDRAAVSAARASDFHWAAERTDTARPGIFCGRAAVQRRGSSTRLRR